MHLMCGVDVYVSVNCYAIQMSHSGAVLTVHSLMSALLSPSVSVQGKSCQHQAKWCLIN